MDEISSMNEIIEQPDDGTTDEIMVCNYPGEIVRQVTMTDWDRENKLF